MSFWRKIIITCKDKDWKNKGSTAFYAKERSEKLLKKIAMLQILQSKNLDKVGFFMNKLGFSTSDYA
jgi:hypothetical protein